MAHSDVREEIPGFVPCPACRQRMGSRDFYFCEPCTAARDAAIEAQRQKCEPLCSNCEQRPPYDEAATLCEVCRDTHDVDDGAKRRRMTADERERAQSDRLTQETMPPLPPELQTPATPPAPRRAARPRARGRAAR